MEPVNLQMPGYRLNEYLLVLVPHEELRNRIHKIHQEFSERFRVPAARNLKSHITLVNFIMWDMMEEKIVQRLQSIAMGVVPFKVEIKDFGSFPSHTIFFNVTSKLPVQSLLKELREAQRLMKLNQENKPHFIDEPHIPLCRKLKPWQYEQGWLDYSQRHFTGRFIADGMMLLKKPAGERAAFQIVRRFEFMNLPVATRQGDLFGMSR